MFGGTGFKSELGNKLAQNVGEGGPGKGRDIYNTGSQCQTERLIPVSRCQKPKNAGRVGESKLMPLGEANGTTVLSAEQVVEIRQLYLLGGHSFLDLAKSFGVPKATIQAVLTSATWAHLLSEGEA